MEFNVIKPPSKFKPGGPDPPEKPSGKGQICIDFIQKKNYVVKHYNIENREKS
jgi:hypothetical protein